ncbi:MAG TPA: ATP-binding protein [Methyloceanibacter sp.]
MHGIGIESVKGLGAYFRSLVHVSVEDDAVASARHQSFIASHVLAGFVALLVFPIYLVVGGKPTLLGAIAFLWLLSPIGLAIFLSRTGKFAAAHLISAANFAGLVTFFCWLTGGIHSFLLPWMIVVPLEAALARDIRIVTFATLLASLGLVTLLVFGAAGMLPANELSLPPLALAFFGAFTALGYVTGLTVSLQSVHRASEDAVRIGEDRYRLLAENTSDLITRHDERGRVVFASLAAQAMFGELPARLYGDGLFERVHVADRPAYLTTLSRCYAANAPMAVEFRALQGAPGRGRHIWLEMRCRPVNTATFGAEKLRAGVVAVTRDITERKAQEEELVRARDDAESANRAKTQFLANMSHELRTPLNAVIGFAEIIHGEMFGELGDARYRDYAGHIHDSGQHLLQVVNEILDMSKIEAGKFKIVKEPFAVRPLIDVCCEVTRQAAEKKEITLIVDASPSLPELAADKRAVKQMLLNLVSNAIKFTDAGGWVRIEARLEGTSVALVVADNGIGIDEADLAKLGNPFIQANNSYDRQHDGAGLGLSVVKGLARLHGGDLSLKSKLGEGTVATLLLPLEDYIAAPLPKLDLHKASAA